mmetsp:Transcript_28454/g.80292  ORF Transcript_28454/g.80292 Transcript_28454/m.80292 type:complete len:265 (+) Transcript_28454:1049-1843(+)
MAPSPSRIKMSLVSSARAAGRPAGGNSSEDVPRTTRDSMIDSAGRQYWKLMARGVEPVEIRRMSSTVTVVPKIFSTQSNPMVPSRGSMKEVQVIRSRSTESAPTTALIQVSMRSTCCVVCNILRLLTMPGSVRIPTEKPIATEAASSDDSELVTMSLPSESDPTPEETVSEDESRSMRPPRWASTAPASSKAAAASTRPQLNCDFIVLSFRCFYAVYSTTVGGTKRPFIQRPVPRNIAFTLSQTPFRNLLTAASALRVAAGKDA